MAEEEHFSGESSTDGSKIARAIIFRVQHSFFFRGLIDAVWIFNEILKAIKQLLWYLLETNK